MTGRVTVTAPGEREIVLTRAFDAPPHLVFAALTRPELVTRWLGARGWNVVDATIDLRVGGAWRFVSSGPGGERMGHGGIYREVVPGERLVYTEEYDDRWYDDEALVRVELVEDPADRTTMTTTLTYPSRTTRDLVLSSPMERGVGEGYERLDELLTEMEERA
jgi:uncharacterized protein YndB with AHSA1/START domain